MNNREQLIRARLGILALAAEVKNVAKACKLAGVSRSQFYALKKAYQAQGKEGLAPKIRRHPNMPNRTPVGVEQSILLKTVENPRFSYIKLADDMKNKGISVTPTMIRYVWRRHGLSTRSARLRWLKTHNGCQGGEIRKSGIDVAQVCGGSGLTRSAQGNPNEPFNGLVGDGENGSVQKSSTR